RLPPRSREILQLPRFARMERQSFGVDDGLERSWWSEAEPSRKTTGRRVAERGDGTVGLREGHGTEVRLRALGHRDPVVPGVRVGAEILRRAEGPARLAEHLARLRVDG